MYHLNCVYAKFDNFDAFLTACICICFCCQQTQNILIISVSGKWGKIFLIQTILHFLDHKLLQVLPMFSRFLLEAFYYPLPQMYLRRLIFKLCGPFPSTTYHIITLFSIKLVLYSKIKINVMIFKILLCVLYLCWLV